MKANHLVTAHGHLPIDKAWSFPVIKELTTARSMLMQIYGSNPRDALVGQRAIETLKRIDDALAWVREVNRAIEASIEENWE